MSCSLLKIFHLLIYFGLPRKFHGQRSLVQEAWWTEKSMGLKSQTQLSTLHTHTHTHTHTGLSCNVWGPSSLSRGWTQALCMGVQSLSLHFLWSTRKARIPYILGGSWIPVRNECASCSQVNLEKKSRWNDDGSRQWRHGAAVAPFTGYYFLVLTLHQVSWGTSRYTCHKSHSRRAYSHNGICGWTRTYSPQTAARQDSNKKYWPPGDGINCCGNS